MLVTCPTADELGRFLIGDTNQGQASEFESHLETCETCRSQLARLTPVDGFVENLRRHSRSRVAVQVSIDEAEAELATLLLPCLKSISGGSSSELNTQIPTPQIQLHAAQFSTIEPFDTSLHGPVTQIGHYEIESVLGHGGMGIVFQARDTRLRRPVAIKQIKGAFSRHPAMLERFVREAQAIAAVDHDRIVPIYAIEFFENQPLIVMPLLRGVTLKDRLDRCPEPLPQTELIRLSREIAEGLAAAHANGLVHRDLKPANIWLEEPTQRVRILDFGLAVFLDQGQRESQGCCGTPGYIAPEQVRGRAIDARVDLFSLGCVMYQMATAKMPFFGPVALKNLWTAIGPIPRSAKAINTLIEPVLSDFIDQMISREPAMRPASAGDVIDFLTALEARDAAARQRRQRRYWMATVLSVAMVGSLVAAWAWQNNGVAPVTVTMRVDDSSRGLQLVGMDQRYELQMGVQELSLVPGMYHVEFTEPREGWQVIPEYIQVKEDSAQEFQVMIAGELARHSFHTQSVAAVQVVGKAPAIQVLSVGNDRTLASWQPSVDRFQGKDGAKTAAVDPLPDVEINSVNLAYAGRCLAIRSDGSEVATAGGNKQVPAELTVERWAPGTLAPLGQPLSGNRKLITSLAYSPQGDRLASASAEGIWIWELETDQAVLLKHAEMEPIYSIAFMQDGQQLLSLGDRGSLKQWDIASEKVVRARTIGDAAQRSLVMGTDSFITGGDDGLVRVWNAASFTAEEHRSQQSAVLALALSADGTRLLIGGDAGSIEVWRYPACEPIAILKGHTQAVQSLAITSDGRHVVSASLDRTVRLWQLPVDVHR